MAALSAVLLVMWRWRRRLIRFAVAGGSMEPTLSPGDFVTVLRLERGRPVKEGSLVVVRDPRDQETEMVKRVVGRTAAGGIIVAGDSPEKSTDSRQFGPVSRDLVIGHVVLRYWPPRRFRAFI